MSYSVSPIDATAMAIFMFEGAREGVASARCIRNNNPGNLRPIPRTVPQVPVDEDNYRTFPSFMVGWNTLQADILYKLKHHLGPKQTMFDFLSLYAPVGDHNNPSAYAKFVCDWLGVSLGKQVSTFTLLKDIFGN